MLVVAAAASLFLPSASEALLTAYDDEPKTWLVSHQWVAGGLLGGLWVAWLIGFVGLFRFKAWARSLALYSTLASTFVHAFLGLSLSSGLTSMLYEGSAMLWGAILALSYFSAVSARFEH